MRRRYAFYAASLRTGLVLADLPLVGVSAQLHLAQGRLQANMKLGRRPGQPKDEHAQMCRDLIEATTPGQCTVVVARDGVVVGEWLIWTRTRVNGSTDVELGGVEVRSWFDHVVVDGFAKKTSIDKLQLSMQLAQHALARPPGITCTVSNPGSSGNVASVADYPSGTDYVGKIIETLGNEINGFDWWVSSVFDPVSSVRKMLRTVRFGYPRRGSKLRTVIDIPNDRPGQSGVRFTLTEDASKVFTTVYMTGTGEGDTQRVARGTNPDLLAPGAGGGPDGYPALENVDARSSQAAQDLLNAQATAAAVIARTAEIPTTVTLRADGDLQPGGIFPGDVLDARVQACPAFPDGLQVPVRVLGLTVRPPSEGLTEIVEVEIGRETD